jgi:hypothetical protein
VQRRKSRQERHLDGDPEASQILDSKYRDREDLEDEELGAEALLQVGYRLGGESCYI